MLNTWLLLFLSVPGGEARPSAAQAREQPLTCAAISLARPGAGVPYRGNIHNADYRFSAIIPNSLTGWGAGPTAPFHGFVIYLSDSSCINFNIGTRVVLPEDLPTAARVGGQGVRVSVGNRIGREKSTTRLIQGVSFENVRVTLRLPHERRTDDVEITLIVPSAEKDKGTRIFRRFLSDLRFW
jgi:hypothetical protein